ncbi:GNAT family N-acetyltransferase [Vibrio sp. CAIM 722]|uniref:GNAT family N-acetyltransferase n=1 Tax=Vibrio eleionomae TaxID=2653505 RepID=A0A7X4RTU4_9VIBR|nr:GNAT family N-acetyltransferase [Vibrio eleionomae]MZI93201.1 GNAT family N-acetyltransferase [Vibrio eleionomae]
MTTLKFAAINLERDFPFCLAARRDSYFCSFHTDEGCEASLAGYRERIEQRLLDPRWYYLHVWWGHTLIGQLEFRTFYDEPEIGYVQLFYLLPEYRGQGLASQLHALIEETLRDAGCTQVQLSVSRTNPTALRFYHRHGWRFYQPNPKHQETDFYRLQLV